MSTETTAKQPSEADVAVYENSAAGFVALRTALGLPQTDNYSKKMGQDTLAKLKSDIANDKPPMTPLIDLMLTRVAKAGLATQGIDPNSAQGKQQVQAFVADPKQRDGMQALINEAPRFVAVLDRVADANAPAAAPAASTSAAPPAPPKEAVQKVEVALKSLGIDVGQVDGIADEKFHQATTNLKNIIASVAGVQVDAGRCTPADCDKLLSGINTFLGSQQYKDLQEIRKGIVPKSLGLDLTTEIGFKAILLSKNEAERIKFALEEKAKTDPKFAQSIAKIPPQILANMPAVLDTLATQKDGLVASLKTVYTPVAASAKPPGAAPATPSAPATVPLPSASTAAPPTTTTDPAPAAAPAAPAALTPEQDRERTEVAVEFVENILHTKIGTAIGDLSKKFGGMFGINAAQFLPIIDESDLKDGKGVFGQKSQDMTAAVIMFLKDMNGDKKANGVYNEKIGEELRFAILTKPEFELIRSKLEIEQYSVEDARKLMKGEKANATEEEKKESERLKTAGASNLKLLFDQLNILKEKKKLDDERAQQMTKYNLMLDGLSVGLDKWAPGVKAWLKDFFTNSQVGQMIGGVLSMFGINVGRLWGDKNDAAAVDRAKPAIEKGFETYLNAQATELKLDVNKDFAKVMESTRAKMMNDLDNNWKFKYSMKLLFGNAEQDVIKNAVQKALDEAAKQNTPDAAKKAFSNYLAEAGKQYQAGNNIDFDKVSRLLAEAQTTAGEAANNPEFLEWQRLQQGQPAATPAPAVTPAPSTSSAPAAPTPAPTTTTPVPPPATPVAPPSGAAAGAAQNRNTTVVSGNGVQAGDQKNIRLDYVEDPTVYKQKLIESNGRVRNLLEVINGNSEKLGMSLPMSMIKEGNGQVVDRATKPASAVIQELLVRAQIEDMKPGEKVDIAKLDKRLTETNLDTVKAYLAIKGVSEADIKKFDDAARSLAKDGALAVSFVGKLQLSMTQLRQIIPEANQSPEVSGAPASPPPAPAKEPPPVAAAPPAAAEAPKEGVKVNPEDQRFYEKYVALNKEKGEAHCAPLVFLGRRDEAGKIVTPEDDKAAGKTNGADGKPLVYEAYAGVVLNNRDADKTNDTFKIYEMKGVVAATLLNPVDPAYKAMRENYIWKDMLVDENDKSKGLKSKAEIDALADKVPNAIDTYIRDTLCIGPQSVKIDARTSVAPASDTSLTTTFTEAKTAARPYPRLYQELLLDKKDTFRISQVEAESLDGGKLNLNELYKQIHPNQYNHEYAQFAEGPYMITVLRNEEDQKKHGGDIAVSRMVQGVMVHVVLDSKRDNIRHPDEYLGKSSKELISDFGRREHAFRTGKGDAPAGLDEFLDRGLEGIAKDSNGRNIRVNSNDYKGTSFLEMMIVTGPEENGAYYPPKNAFNTLFGADGDWRARKDYATIFEGRAQQRVAREFSGTELDRQPDQRGWNPRYMSDARASLSDKFGEPVALAAVSDDKFGQNAGDMGLYEVDPAVLGGAGGPALRGKTPSYGATA